MNNLLLSVYIEGSLPMHARVRMVRVVYRVYI